VPLPLPLWLSLTDLEDAVWDGTSHQPQGALIGERVAVVAEQVVGGSSETGCHGAQMRHKFAHRLGRAAQRDSFNGGHAVDLCAGRERSGMRWAMASTRSRLSEGSLMLGFGKGGAAEVAPRRPVPSDVRYVARRGWITGGAWVPFASARTTVTSMVVPLAGWLARGEVDDANVNIPATRWGGSACTPPP